MYLWFVIAKTLVLNPIINCDPNQRAFLSRVETSTLRWWVNAILSNKLPFAPNQRTPTTALFERTNAFYQQHTHTCTNIYIYIYIHMHTYTCVYIYILRFSLPKYRALHQQNGNVKRMDISNTLSNAFVQTWGHAASFNMAIEHHHVPTENHKRTIFRTSTLQKSTMAMENIDHLQVNFLS